MPKNKGKGGKNRRRGKNENEEKRELTYKETGQEYAQVTRMLGNGRLEATCFDGQKRLCHIRGKLRKKVWVNQGDIVLLGLRDYQDGKADVILKYNSDEARLLKAYGELPENAHIVEGGPEADADDPSPATMRVEFVSTVDTPPAKPGGAAPPPAKAAAASGAPATYTIDDL
eukprot:TRINITY_DN109_c0_g1_i3.p1 TRINITY_DN109_c0_g1~~TRINITY_DN109_c0_g1_i3.p1  ORF type:complete len:172 (-),score=47.27 TRINITY_DN109_c0_g1_i3:169-684(-)